MLVLTGLLIGICLAWAVLAVDYRIYRLLGREGFCEGERNHVFRFTVRKLGGWAFLLWFFLTPIILATVVLIWPDYEIQLIACGAAIGVIITVLINDIDALRESLTELEAEEALDGPEADLAVIRLPEEHKREYCDRLKCERVSSFKWLNESWICCGIARNPSKPGDVIITCHAVPRGDNKLAVLTVEQRPDEAALMLKIIHDALAYYLAEEAYKRYGYELGDEGDEQEKEA